MKYLKKFSLNENVEQDPEFALTKIKEQYSISKVKEMLQKEKEEWCPENVDDSWYDENNNGEAQDIIIEKMIRWFESNFYKLSEENFNKIESLIQKHYSILNI